MRPLRTHSLALIALALLAPSMARAEVSPENAQALEQQLHDWLNGLIGSLIGVPDRPVQIVPEDDHYRVTVPLGDALAGLGLEATSATFTAEARPLPRDRWALDDIRIPNVKIVAPAGASGKAFGWSLSIEEQHISAVIDPGLATVSTFDTEIAGQTSTNEGQNGAHASSLEHYVAHGVWMPAGDGRLDMIGNSQGTNLKASQIMPDGTPVNWSIGRLQSDVRIDGVAAASFGAIIHAAFDLAPAITEAQQTGRLPPEAREPARVLIRQIRDLLNGFEGSETLEEMHLEAAGYSGSFSRLAMGFGAGGRQGKVDIHVRLALDGLETPDVPAGPLHDYLPRHIAVDPRISGLPIEDATQLLLRAIDSDEPNGAELSEQAAALLQRSPVTIGLDSLDLELGPARLHGSGGVEISGPDQVSGEGRITMIGLDALMRSAATVPELKAALPVLIMAKGLGQQEGNATTWRVTYSGNKIMVNDNDLSAMLPGAK